MRAAIDKRNRDIALAYVRDGGGVKVARALAERLQVNERLIYRAIAKYREWAEEQVDGEQAA